MLFWEVPQHSQFFFQVRIDLYFWIHRRRPLLIQRGKKGIEPIPNLGRSGVALIACVARIEIGMEDFQPVGVEILDELELASLSLIHI